MATLTVSGFNSGDTRGNFETFTKNGLSAALSSFGWVQTSDTNQQNWTDTTIGTISQVDGSGNYTYDAASLTGPKPSIGQFITITGFSNGGNNVTNGIITATSGSGASSIFTVGAASTVSETPGSPATGTVTYYLVSTAWTVYEMWHMADTNESACPCFLRVQYAIDPSNRITFSFNFGQGSDGKGNVLGAQTALRGYSSGANVDDTNTVQAFFSGDTNRLSMVMFARNGSASLGGSTRFVVVVERAHDSSGVDTAEYYTIAAFGSTLSRQQSIFADGSSTVGETNGWMGILPASATTGAFGTGIAISPIFPMIGKLDNPMIGVTAGKTNDFVDLSTFTMSMYGTSHTYLMQAFVLNSILANQGTCNPAIRYD